MKTASLILLTAFMLGKVQAQTDTSTLNTFSLKELLNVKVVTASRFSQSAGTAPASVVVITRDQIRMRGYQSLLDVMYDLPDVKVDDKIYSGNRNSFTVRGTQGAEKFIILLDGIYISSPSGESMAIMENYPVNLAEQIEVLYGPASALYGANAVSGVINIISRKAAAKGLTVEASTTGGMYGYTNTSLFIAKKLGEKARFVLSGQYAYDQGADYSKIYSGDSALSIASYSTGTLNTVFGPATPVTPIRAKYEAPMEAYNIYAALHIDNFTFSVFSNYFKMPSSLGSNTSNAIYNKEVNMIQSITSATAAYKCSVNKILFTTSFTGSQYILDPKSNYRNLYTGMEQAYKYSLNSMVKTEQQLDYKPSDKLSLSAGVAVESYTAVPQSADLSKPVNPKDHVAGSYLGTAAYYRPDGLPAQFYFIKYNNIGGYFETQYSHSKKLHLTIGSRYDRNSRYGSTFNPRLGFVYQAAEGTTIKMLYGSAYFAPAPSTSYVQYGSFQTYDSGRTYQSSFLHLPNPGLKPITSKNIEFNIRQDVTRNLVLSASVYATFLRGLYEFSDDNATAKLYNNSFNGIPVDYIEIFTNNNRQKNFGANVQLNWKYTAGSTTFNSYASVSYVTGRVEKGLTEKDETEADRELDFIAPFMFRIGTDIKGRKFSVSPRLLIMSRQHIAGISDTSGGLIRRQTIGGYALLNVSFRYHATRRVSFYTNISNALNQKYRAVGFNMDLTKQATDIFPGQPQDPIRIMGGVSFTF